MESGHLAVAVSSVAPSVGVFDTESDPAATAESAIEPVSVHVCVHENKQ